VWYFLVLFIGVDEVLNIKVLMESAAAGREAVCWNVDLWFILQSALLPYLRPSLSLSPPPSLPLDLIRVKDCGTGVCHIQLNSQEGEQERKWD